MMSTAGTPASRNGRWSSSIGVDSATNSGRFSLRAADQIASVSHGVELLSRLKTRFLVADHVDQDQRLDLLQRAGLRAAVDVVPAAEGVPGVPLAERLFAVEEQDLDRQRVLAVLQHPRQLDQKRGAGAARRSRRRTRTP